MKKSLFSLAPAALVAAAVFLTACESPDAGADSGAYSTNGGAPSSAAAAPRALPGGEVVAVVNGIALTEPLLSIFSQPGRPLSVAIDNLVMSEIVAEEAEKSESIAADDDVLSQLASSRYDILARAYVGRFIADNAATEEEMLARYEEIKTQYEGKSEYLVAHILVEEEERAREMLAQLQESPDDFGDLAREHSKDPGSAQNGGSLGWGSPDLYVPEFSAAVQEITAGEIGVEPIKSQFGWHIIRVDESRPVAVPELDNMRDNLKRIVEGEKVQKRLEELRAKSQIEIKKDAS